MGPGLGPQGKLEGLCVGSFNNCFGKFVPFFNGSGKQILSTFLRILNSRKTCGPINKFTHCYSLVFTQVKSNDIKMCKFISTR